MMSIDIENIPTPDEIPSPVSAGEQKNFSETFDEVLAQNADLMYRLNVAIRRCANLETRVIQTEEENNYLKQKTRSMDDELDILRNENSENAIELKHLSCKLSDSEMKYARLYEIYNLQEQNLNQTTNKLAILNRFKSRVSFYVRLFIDGLKKEISELKEGREKHNEEVYYFKSAISELRKKVIHLENQLICAKKRETNLRTQFASDLEEAVSTIDQLKQNQAS